MEENSLPRTPRTFLQPPTVGASLPHPTDLVEITSLAASPGRDGTAITLDNRIVVQVGVHHHGYIGQFYPVSGPAGLVDQMMWDELVEVFEVLFTRAPR